MVHILLHCGFHKTGTTYVQNKLWENRRLLAAHGIKYVRHRHTRKHFTVPYQLNAREKLGIDYKTKIGDAELAAIRGEFFAGHVGTEHPFALISDENFLGHAGDVARYGGLYRFRRAFLDALATQIEGEDSVESVRIFCCIRNYADFFAASYSEYLRSAKAENFEAPEVMKERVFEKRPSWVSLLKSMRSRLPGAEIVVWRYEDFRAVTDRVFEALCMGRVPGAHLKEPSDGKPRPSASAEALRAFFDIVAARGAKAAFAARRNLELQFPKNPGSPGFDPWTADERMAVNADYPRHWERIRSMPSVRLIERQVPRLVAC